MGVRYDHIVRPDGWHIVSPRTQLRIESEDPVLLFTVLDPIRNTKADAYRAVTEASEYLGATVVRSGPWNDVNDEREKNLALAAQPGRPTGERICCRVMRKERTL